MESFRVAIVVLHEGDGAIQCHTRKEDGADPVMRRALLDLDLFCAVPRLEARDHDLALLQLIEQLAALLLGLAVDPQKRRRAGHLLGHSSLGERDVPLEGRERARLQLEHGRGR